MLSKYDDVDTKYRRGVTVIGQPDEHADLTKQTRFNDTDNENVIMFGYEKKL